MKDLQFEYEQTLLKSHIEIQEQTLLYVSQEIHDNIGQVLSLVSLNLNTISSPDNDKLEFTAELVTKAISDLRSLSKSLNPDRVKSVGLTESIAAEADHLSRTGEFKVVFNMEKELKAISPENTVILYRMVQEVLNNIIKHSKANTITIKVFEIEGDDVISISDNGVGFDLGNDSSGLGLQNLNKRAAMIQTGLQIMSRINEGTSVSFTIKS